MAGAAARLYVEIGADVKGAVAGMKATDAQLKKTAASAKRTEAQMMAAGTSTRKAASGFSLLGGSAKQATREVERTTPAMNRSAKASRAARGAVQGFGSSSTAAQGGVLALAYGLTKSVKNAADFDSAMRNVNSIAGLSENQFKRVKQSVLDMAGPTAQAPQTLAEGMYQLVSSGFSAGESLKIIRSSAIAATAGLTDTATATTAVAGVLNAYHLKASKAQQVSDDLFQTVNLGVLSFEDLAQGIGPVLPFASRLGVSLKQVGAMTATLTKAGIPAAEAFTYQKGAMAQLLKPTDSLNRRFKELGVSSGRELVHKTGSLQGALEALFRSVGGNDKKFAKLFPDIRGLSAAFTATGSGAKGAAKDLRDFNDTAGKTAQVFAEQKKGDAFGFKQLNADAKQLSITLGGPLARNLSQALHPISQGAQSNTGKDILKVATAGIPQAIHEIKSRYQKAFGGIGKGANVGDVKTNFRIKVLGGDNAVKQIGPVKKGLATIPGITTARIRIISPDDVVATRTRTALTRLARPIKIKTEYTRAGNANTVVTNMKPVRITADNSDVRAKTQQAKSFVEGVSGLRAKPKITASTNAEAAKNQTLQALAAVDGKTATAHINIVTSKTGSKATGGRNTTSLTEVNERGPEAASYKGQTWMLGNGKRQVMALPIGAYVHNASDTRAMQHLAGGGWVKPTRKKGEKHDHFQKRLDKWQAKVDRRNQSIDRKSGIGDSRSDEAIAKIPLTVDKDGNVVENTAAIDAKNVSRAKRHLAEAQKKKGPDRAAAVAAAKAELAQAKRTQELDAKQLEATQNNTDALKAQTEQLAALKASVDESNRLTSTTHNVTMSQVGRALTDIFNQGEGGRLAMSQRTLGPAAAY